MLKSTYTVSVRCTNCDYKGDDYEIKVRRSVKAALEKASCPTCGLARLEKGTPRADGISAEPN